jgi:hypothetical protein
LRHPPDHAAGRTARQQRAELAADHRAEQTAGHRHGHEQKGQQVFDLEAVFSSPSWSASRGFRQALTADARHERVRALVKSAGVVPGLEGGSDDVACDLPCGQVGHRTFQRLGRGDPQPAVVLGHHQQQAVAHVFAADLPGLAHALGEGCDVLGLGGGHHQHHDLRAGLGLEGGQLGLQRVALCA